MTYICSNCGRESQDHNAATAHECGEVYTIGTDSIDIQPYAELDFKKAGQLQEQLRDLVATDGEAEQL
jgi:hypothetical protein